MGSSSSKQQNVRYGPNGEPYPVRPQYYNGQPYYDDRSTSQKWADDMTAKTGKKWKKGQVEGIMAGSWGGAGC